MLWAATGAPFFFSQAWKCYGGELDPPEKLTKPIVVIGACTRSVPEWTDNSLPETSLQALLIPSIRRTITEEELYKWDVRLYLGIDDGDAFWLKHHKNLKSPPWLTVDFGFYPVTGRIPFNEMMKHAYDDGAEYFVRINDDTEFKTSGWITHGVKTLQGFDPPNVGVVGPACRQGSNTIMTHDMVHRTHLSIFDTYYPAVFSAWWIDDWMMKVYKPGRSIWSNAADWEVHHHTAKHGTRYKVKHEEAGLLDGELTKGQQRIEEWLVSNNLKPSAQTGAGLKGGLAPGEKECATMQKAHNVVVGTSWGTMPLEKRRRWDAIGCDSHQRN